MMKLGFIGAGKLGTGLAASLHNKGEYQVVMVYDIVPDAAKAFVEVVEGCQVAGNGQEVADKANLIFVTVLDDHITSVCSQIQWHVGQSVVHCSGANSTDLLEPAKKQGANVAVFHPGFMFANVKQTVRDLPGKTFDIEAEEPLLSTLKDIAATLHGQCIEVGPRERPVYHVAEEFVSMYVLLLVKLATELMRAINIPQDQAVRALFPMLRGTVNQIETIGVEQHIPGPVARYDLKTIRRHLNGLKAIAPDILSLYRELAFQSIPVVLTQGSMNQIQAEEVKNLLDNFD